MRQSISFSKASFLAALLAALTGCSADGGVAEQPGEGPGPSQSSRDASTSTADAVAPIDVASTPAIVCLVDADCQTTNPCRSSRCELDGEIGACIYDPVADGAACSVDGCAGTCTAGECGGTTCGGTVRDAGTRDRNRDAGTATDSGGGYPGSDAGMPEPSVDPVCEGTCPFDRIASVFPPFVALLPDDVPATCHNGFQLGGASGGCGVSVYTIHSTRAGGARDITLDVDFATYLVPDGVTVTGVDATGVTYTLMATCRLQTYDHAGPSTMRPLDATIRQFRLHLRPGTTQLTFDFGPVTSPMYMRVVGLCDFDVTQFTHAAWWEAVP
jgi:hypothetical protein